MEFDRVKGTDASKTETPVGASEDVLADPTPPRATRKDAPDSLRKVPRDRWGRPRIFPLDGGKSKGYQRCTRFVSVLEDEYNLNLWNQRMVAIGLAEREDLLVSVAAFKNDKQELNKIVERAREAAGANSGSTTGTALHKICEDIDSGLSPVIPSAYKADVAAYVEATKPFEVVSIEEFCVNDQYEVGGTPDRVYKFNDKYYIGDLKTSGDTDTLKLSLLKFAMQFAMYAHSKPYLFEKAPDDPDAAPGAEVAKSLRMEWPGPIDPYRAILVHLPKGKGTCDVYWVDISEGWEAVKIAAATKAWRKKGAKLATPFNSAVEAARFEIDEATDVDAIRAVYSNFVAAGNDPSLIVDYCKERKSNLMHQEAHEQFLRSKQRSGNKQKPGGRNG